MRQFAKAMLGAAGAAVLIAGTAAGAAAFQANLDADRPAVGAIESQVGGRPEPVGKTEKPRTDVPKDPAKNAAAMKDVKAAGKVTAVENKGKTVVIDGKIKVVVGDAKVMIRNAPGKPGDIVAGMTCDVDNQKKPTTITCK